MSNRRKAKPTSSHPTKTDPPHSNAIQLISSEQFIGPIPPPEVFRQYAEVLPDAPERILKVFEENSSFAREVRFQALVATKSEKTRAQWMAFCLVLGGLLGAVFLAYLDKEITAGILLGTTIAGIITGFLKSGQLSQQSDKEE